MSNEAPTRDALDDKLNRVFAGKVVRKDLVRKVKVGANVPVFVLEYLLGKYCASSDEVAIQMGLQVVNDTLANNYIRADEAMKAQSRVKERGRHTFIDKVKVRVVDSDYWAEVNNFGHKFVHVPEHYVRDYERLLMGGIWAQVDMRFEYDEESGGKNPFWIEKITPIQIANFDLDEYRTARREFTTEEWVDVMLRSMGYEPDGMDSLRLKLLFLVRLIPLVERNYNLIELGPRGTGKSYVVQEISPYSALLTGSPTVAGLFGHMSGRQKGLLQLWDVVAFDEVAELRAMPKELVPMLQTYCESGQFQRGSEAATGEAGLALFGNTNRPVDVMVQTSHLFEPLPENLRALAFLDRLHFYLPGWEIPKMTPRLFTNHYGFVVDYMAEALRELRKTNFTELADREFGFGSHLVQRDRKAVQKTFSGLMKIVHPHGEASRDDMVVLLEVAIEGRRRVKEQLKKLGSFEYHQTSFSYVVRETGEERFVGVPEQGGRNLIPVDPPGPGTVFTAGVTDQGIVGLYRLEVTLAPGSGKLKTAGGISGTMKESVTRAFTFLASKKTELGFFQDLDTHDFVVEAIDLLGNHVEADIGVAFFVAACSALRRTSVSAGLLVLGDMSVQGNIKPARSLNEPLRVAMDNGAKRALIPIENKRNFLDVAADVMEQVDPIFYGDPKTAAQKVIG
jgi:ATP-dependent Lon protease